MVDRNAREERQPTGQRDPDSAGGALLLFDSGPWASRVATQNLDQYHHGKVSDLDGFFDELHVISFPHAESLTARFSPRHWFHQVSPAGPVPDALEVPYFRSAWPRGRQVSRLEPGPREAALHFEERRWRLPLPHFLLPGRPAGTALALLQALAFARRIVAHRPVAAVAGNDPFLRGLAAIALSRTVDQRLPAVLVVRGDHEQIRKLRGGAILSVFRQNVELDRAFERWVFSQADLVIADRDYYAEYAVAHGADPSRVAQVGMAVHEDFYSDLPGEWDPSWGEEGPDRNRPLLSALARKADRYVLVVGRLADEKYPLDTLEAVALARRTTGLDVVLVFSGAGPLEEALRRRARELGMAQATFFPGNLDRRRLRRAMAECDALLAPCTGFALAEAALRAAPIVAYDWEWHGEVVQHERTGLMVPFRDTEAMGLALSRLLENPTLARSLGDRARRHAMAHFAPGRNIRNLRRAFRRVLS